MTQQAKYEKGAKMAVRAIMLPQSLEGEIIIDPQTDAYGLRGFDRGPYSMQVQGSEEWEFISHTMGIPKREREVLDAFLRRLSRSSFRTVYRPKEDSFKYSPKIGSEVCFSRMMQDKVRFYGEGLLSCTVYPSIDPGELGYTRLEENSNAEITANFSAGRNRTGHILPPGK